MLREENELLTQTGPGSLMGNLIREYWIPALRSDELMADSDPIRLRLLGENLVAFRATNGQVGILDHRCPHRCASLFFGRNEDDGLRCVYHGWKFDVNGQCVDMPSEAQESDFKNKVSARAYPSRERNGLVWTYMGPRAKPPPLPSLEASMLPEEDRVVQPVMRECNWLQALEGDIDTSHFGFLHMGSAKAEDFVEGTTAKYYLKDRAPRYEVVASDSGTMYGAYRPAEEGSYYWRVAQFLFPFWTMPPAGKIEGHVIVRAWVPIDDEHTMFWNLSRKRKTGSGPVPTSSSGRPTAGLGLGFDFLPNTPDWLGRWRLAANQSNDYKIDREVQKDGSYSGILGVHLQDQAITESMGAIVDRTHERLGSSDQMIIQTRRRLMGAARALRDHNTVPTGVDNPEVYERVRGGEMILSRDRDWNEAYEEKRKAFQQG